MTPTKDPVSPERVAEAVERLTHNLAMEFPGMGAMRASVSSADLRTLLSTIDHLRGEVEKLACDLGWANLRRQEAIDRHLIAEARCAALVEALEPFAEAGKRLATREEFSLSAEQFIRADQALKAVTPTTSDGDIGEASGDQVARPQTEAGEPVKPSEGAE